jgi:PBP1b-binding outer membrane lipoprotein LpoB
MKRIWTLIVLLALILAGCTQKVPETTPSATEPIPTVPVRQRYSDAVERVKDAKNLVLDYTISSQRQIGENLFPSKITGKASYSNFRWSICWPS